MTTTNWNKIPPPPRPNGINQFPGISEPFELSLKSIPDQTENDPKYLDLMQITRKNQEIRVLAQWQKVVSCSASPATPFSQLVSVTNGTAITNSQTQQYSASMGVSGDMGSISASITETFSHSVTFSTATTVSDTFSVTPKSGEVSIVWWQLVHIFILTGTEELTMKGQVIKSGHYKSIVSNHLKTFVATSFPKNAEVETKGLEDFLH
ncbi:hypothetical protein [uncultured Dokdonia sp.]|uniref:hypothetical protein n=1 Tax=uncultured Dokdonia sp. TaxID=575653 RepID=UPI00261E56DF|nr:hypothetical protein [uncultured Dokdonia sp.]